MLKAVRGTKDIFSAQMRLFRHIEARARSVFAAYNYQEISTPLIEDLALFKRTLGLHSDIVSKQMFVIKKDNAALALRPEGTASVARAYLEASLDKIEPISKFYYTGAMFRAERPQKGRLRQFHHIGAEYIGVSNPYADCEIICLADNILRKIGIVNFEIKLNSLGCLKDKQNLASILKKLFKDKLSLLCPDCRSRYNKNVFRILDCKNAHCREIVRGLNLNNQHLCSGCLNNLDQLESLLKAIRIKYTLVKHLVRGLDYYTGTVFEIAHKNLGAQDAIGAGGRYDNLIKELGGAAVPAMGFAFGIERLLLALPSSLADTKEPEKINAVFIAVLGARAVQEGFLLLDILRKRDIISEMDSRGLSLKASLRRADKLNFRFVILLGDNEIDKKIVLLKDMEKGGQEELARETLIPELEKRL